MAYCSTMKKKTSSECALCKNKLTVTRWRTRLNLNICDYSDFGDSEMLFMCCYGSKETTYETCTGLACCDFNSKLCTKYNYYFPVSTALDTHRK